MKRKFPSVAPTTSYSQRIWHIRVVWWEWWNHTLKCQWNDLLSLTLVLHLSWYISINSDGDYIPVTLWELINPISVHVCSALSSQQLCMQYTVCVRDTEACCLFSFQLNSLRVAYFSFLFRVTQRAWLFKRVNEC